jgi:hypothetical protein
MPLWRRLLARRSLIPFVGSTIYALAAAYQGGSSVDGGSSGFDLIGFFTACSALFLAVHAAFRVRMPAALAEWGAALIVASLAGEPGASWGEVAGSVGALVACFAAARAMSAVEGASSLASAASTSAWQVARSDSLAITGGLVFAWGMAVYVHAAAALGSDSLSAQYSRPLATFFGVVGGGVLFLACLRAGAARQFELGVAERFRASAALLSAGVALSCIIAMSALGPSDRAVRTGIGSAAVLVVAVSMHGDPVAIARMARVGVVLSFLLGPLVLIASLMAIDRPLSASWVVCCSGVLAALGGVVAPGMARGLRPARGAWLDAIAKAEEALLREEPVDALGGVLMALREPAGPSARSPELWTFDPMRVLRIDAAGYARSREEVLLAELITVASQEREAVLRTNVLEALEVRRPDLRPVLRWMEDRDALACAVVVRAGEPEGLLVLPRGSRSEAMSLEEVLALRRLAERLGAACHAESATARARARERELAGSAEDAEEKAARLEHAAEVDAARHVRATTRLARPATVGIYSANARLAYDALERRAKAGAPQVVVARSGVDPVPYLARAHLSGARKTGPFVLVDGTGAREHDMARWTDPVASPLSLADGGVLVLVDGACLPGEVQRLLARALSEKRAPWERAEPLDIAIVLTTVPPPSELVDSGMLDPSLASRFGDALENAVLLPLIRERPEDMRAIVTDRLAREGMRVMGSPVGLEDGAYARLVEYPFLGEDAEVATLVRQLVARCAADNRRLVVRAADIDALGLDFVDEAAQARNLPGGRGIRLV